MDTKVCIKDGIKGVHSQPTGPVHNGIKGVLTSAYKEAGVRGLYRGVGMCVLEFTNTTFMHYNHIIGSCWSSCLWNMCFLIACLS